ncbi:boron transporter 1-like protein [Tanacetum coccineum]
MGEDPPELLQKVVPLIASTFIDIISRSYPTLPPPATSYRFHPPGTFSCIRVYYNVAEFWKTTYNVTFVETVSFGTTATFTLIQTSYLLIYIGLAWLPIVGLFFPLMIMLLVPVRQYILPKFFKCVNLQDLDAVAYEEAHVIPFNYPRVKISSVVADSVMPLTNSSGDSRDKI